MPRFWLRQLILLCAVFPRYARKNRTQIKIKYRTELVCEH